MRERAPRPGGEWESIAGRLEELKAVLPDLAELPRIGPSTAPHVLARLAETVESMGRRRIRDQIQMGSLQEIAESLLQGRNPGLILTTLTLYLRQALDLEDVLLLRRLPRNGTCEGFHACRAEPGARSLGLVQWRREWSEFLPASSSCSSSSSSSSSSSPSSSSSSSSLSSSNAVRTESLSEPSSYRFVLPLGRSRQGGEGDAAGFSLLPFPLGLLCLSPSGQATEETLQPQAVARLVEGILETLSHREQMESEARFRKQLLLAMRDGVLAVNKDGTIVELNAAAGELLGLAPSEALGRAIDSLSEVAPQLVSDLKEGLSTGKEPAQRELTLGADESRLRINVAASRLHDETGERDGLVVNLTDLTPLRAMEEKVHRLDRLAALGRFAAGVAHEIRNPLAGIGAGVEYLSDKVGRDPAVQEDLQFLRNEIRRLDRIVSDLLEYTRPRALDRQWIEAGSLVERIRLALSPLIEKRGVPLMAEGPARLLLRADPDRLEQVLINLVKNAIEASPGGLPVRIAWESRPGRRVGEERSVLFRVVDDGPGMSAEDLARAFEPFYTTKGNGTGLGLSLSHAIVEQHGGRLLLESTPGRGTTVLVEIPGEQEQRSVEDAIIHSDRR